MADLFSRALRRIPPIIETLSAPDRVRLVGALAKLYGRAMTSTERSQLRRLRNETVASRAPADATKSLQSTPPKCNEIGNEIVALGGALGGAPVVSEVASIENQLAKKTGESSTPIQVGGGQLLTGFALFWAAYPIRIGKGAALKSWQKHHCERIANHIVDALQNGHGFRMIDGQPAIPNPATWLNQRRWEDDPPAQMSTFSSKTTARLDAAKTFVERRGDAR